MSSSYWLQTTKKTKFDPLIQNIQADVCIIGGGLTGLTTAYYLSKSNLKVVLIERDEIISKTSGHTTGKITSQHGLFYDYLIKSQGEEKARQYLKANEQAIQNISKIIKTEKIDCDFEYQNAYVFTQKPEEVEKIKKEVEALKLLDFPAKYVTKAELPLNILAAIQFPNQAQFHPAKYAEGLVNSIKNTVQIYEHTKVVDLKKEEESYQVITEKENIVTAKYVVVASHYPIFNIPGYHFLKMYQSMSYLMAFETQEKLFDGMYINSETPTLSFRTAENGDKRILLVGGLEHKTGEEINLAGIYKQLEQITRQYYPDAKLIAKWATEDCISLDKIPYIGEYSNFMPHVYVATGFKKWGMTTSNVAANIITDKILGKENPYEEVFRSTRMEPIKNHKEMGNIIKEAVTSIGLKKLTIPEETLKDILPGQGGLIEYENKKIGVYRDENGKVYGVKPICTHLGCSLTWNNLEKTWDCPCHGSRFDYMGKSMYSPSIKNLDTIEIISII